MLNQTTLRICNNRVVPKWEDFGKTVRILNCYLMESGLMDENNQLVSEKANEHLLANYPVNELDLFACTKSGKLIRSRFVYYFLQPLILWFI